MDAASRSHPHRILILGHSYVRRLKEFVNSCNLTKVTPNFGLDSERFVIHYEGYGGADIGRIHAQLYRVVNQFQPDLVILQVGSNDISNANKDPAILADKLTDLANRLHFQFHVRKVVISELFFRNKWRGGNFNDVTKEINNCLRAKIPAHSKSAGISFWRHFGFRDPLVRRSLQNIDMVHFNDAGNLKYYKSLKRAILKSY